MGKVKAAVIPLILSIVLIAGGRVLFPEEVNKPATEVRQAERSDADGSGRKDVETEGSGEVSESLPVEELHEVKVNHTYRIVIDDVTWEEAVEKARKVGGYLAEISSEEENKAVVDQLKKEGGEIVRAWVGGRRTDGAEDFVWNTSDQKVAFFDWSKGEPSVKDELTGDKEDYLCLWLRDGKGPWKWNDVPNDILAVMPEISGKIGYIVEFEHEE